MAGEIDGHDAICVGERIELVTPVRSIARPAVDENNGASAAAGNVETDCYAVR